MNGKDDIYCKDDFLTNANWRHIPGKLKHVAVNNGKLYGTNHEDKVWYRP